MNSTKSSRCSRHAILAVAAFSFALSSASHAQTQTPTQTLDGEYDGTLSCDPVVNHAEFESFRHAITIRVDGEDVFWTRDVDQMLETGTHYLDGSQFFLDAVGESRARPGERWRVQGTI